MVEGLNNPPIAIAGPIAAILLLAIVDLVIVFLFFAKFRRLSDTSAAIYAQYKLRQLKYLAILSLAGGLFGTMLQTRTVFYMHGVMGWGWNGTIGLLGEALDAFVVGIAGFMFGVVCMIVVHTRSSRVMTDKRT